MSAIGSCPICASGLQGTSSQVDNADAVEYPCIQCGEYRLTGRATACLPNLLGRDPLNSLRLSHALIWMRRDKAPPIVDAELLEKLSYRSLPEIPEQADNLIRWLGQVTRPGHSQDIHPSGYQAVVGAESIEGLTFLLKYLMSIGRIEGEFDSSGGGIFELTFAGREYYTELIRGAKASRRAFMAMAYGQVELDRIVEDVFKPAVKTTGFDLQRVDENPRAGLIDDKLRVDIRLSRFLIADLTHENRGAYWEAGFAEGLGKPVIYTCEKAKFESRDKTHSTHFDTNHHLTVLWDPTDPKKAADDLKATIRATLPGEALMQDPPQ